MIRGALLHLDVAQITLYAFWLFFAGLVWYLRQEDRREGYPLESEQDGVIRRRSPVFIPEAKTFRHFNGDVVQAPADTADRRPLNAVKTEPWPGAPYTPTGDALLAGVGPGSWAVRPEKPYLTAEGHNLLAPMRVATNFAVAPEDVSPLGFTVIGGDRRVVGTIKDLWVDRSESQVRYYEIALEGGRSVLVPVYFADVHDRARKVTIKALQSAQFASVPGLANPDAVTMQEEDKISAFYGGGLLYASPTRTESLI